MSKETRTTLYKAALGDWDICEKIGRGSQGKTAVFRIEKRNATYKEVNALKVISITDEGGKYGWLSEQEKADYQEDLARRKEKAESELRLMHELRSVPEIVDFHEHKYVDWQEDDRFGCDLLIRMDYLACLRRSEGDLLMTAPEDAVAIGISVCKALSACHNHEKRIIHRDVKPENIFKKGNGWYQLGDFGIARALGSSNYASTLVCSKPYAAPEVLAGEKYSERADIYGLGVTLYEICNNGCLPFSESRYDKQTSIEKRIGENLTTPPKNADDHLAGIILKACARDPKNRWRSVRDMQRALEDPNSTSPAVPGGGGGKKRSRLVPVIAAVAAVLCIAIAARGGLSSGGTGNPPGSTPVSSMGTGTQPNNTPNTPGQQASTQPPSPAQPQDKTETGNPDTEAEPPAGADSDAEQSAQSKPELQPQPEAVSIAVAAVALNQSELSMKTGGSATLSANVSPTSADDRSVTWKSSDPSIVSVIGGVLTAQGDGTAVITASAGGKSAKCTVTVQTDWSDWMDELPAGVMSRTETRTVYRYTDYTKTTTTSYSSTPPSGYTLDYSTIEETVEPEEVVDVEGHYEYRYGCWVGADGGHSYCNVMAEKYYGAPAKIAYTSWSPTQYVKTDTKWTCGSGDTGKHKHSGTGGWLASDTGNRVWNLYSSNGSTKTESGYYWEETRWVDTTYKTEYNTVTKLLHHYYMKVIDYTSTWSTDRPEEREDRTIEEKMQYRYMIAD